jgi:hypothetical protein
MPILKVSDQVKKIALEVIRVPISPLGDCPQCQGNGYRDGICPDCAYIDPTVLQAIKEWQDAMGIQNAVRQQQQNPDTKAAYKSLAFTDILPGNFEGLELNGPSSGKVNCPRCGQLSFNNDSVVKGQLSGSCENSNCLHEIAGALGFKRPKFLGIDNKWRKNVDRGRNFLSPAGTKIEKNKKKIKKSTKEQGIDPGALLDDSMIVVTDDAARAQQMIQQKALIDTETKQNAQSEELK